MNANPVSDDDILGLLDRYYYLTNGHIMRRFFARSSDSWVRKRTARLASDGLIEPIPASQKRRLVGDPCVYQLTRKGQHRLEEIGYSLPSRHRDGPIKLTLHLEHTFGAADFFLALERLADMHPDVSVDDVWCETDFNRSPAAVILASGKEVKVKPDGWARVFVGENEYCIALEYDRDSEEQSRWTPKIEGLLTWAETSYKQDFSPHYLTIAVVAETGAKRRDQLIRWTEHALTKFGRRDAAELFLFTDLVPAGNTPYALFCSPNWIAPFTRQVEPLLPGVERAGS